MAPELKPLLSEIEAYQAASGMSDTKFGRAAMNDGSFLPNLRDGREVRFATIRKLRAFMAANPPARSDEGAAA